jgi:hypothetical protein
LEIVEFLCEIKRKRRKRGSCFSVATATTSLLQGGSNQLTIELLATMHHRPPHHLTPHGRTTTYLLVWKQLLDAPRHFPVLRLTDLSRSQLSLFLPPSSLFTAIVPTPRSCSPPQICLSIELVLEVAKLEKSSSPS